MIEIVNVFHCRRKEHPEEEMVVQDQLVGVGCFIFYVMQRLIDFLLKCHDSRNKLFFNHYVLMPSNVLHPYCCSIIHDDYSWLSVSALVGDWYMSYPCPLQLHLPLPSPCTPLGWSKETLILATYVDPPTKLFSIRSMAFTCLWGPRNYNFAEILLPFI